MPAAGCRRRRCCTASSRSSRTGAADERAIVLVGDFNCPAAHRRATDISSREGHYRDAWLEAGRADDGEVTYHGFTGATPPDGRAACTRPTPLRSTTTASTGSWCVASSRAGSADIDVRREEDVMPSDHYPVVAVPQWSDSPRTDSAVCGRRGDRQRVGIAQDVGEFVPSRLVVESRPYHHPLTLTYRRQRRIARDRCEPRASCRPGAALIHSAVTTAPVVRVASANVANMRFLTKNDASPCDVCSFASGRARQSLRSFASRTRESEGIFGNPLPAHGIPFCSSPADEETTRLRLTAAVAISSGPPHREAKTRQSLSASGRRCALVAALRVPAHRDARTSIRSGAPPDTGSDPDRS